MKKKILFLLVTLLLFLLISLLLFLPKTTPSINTSLIVPTSTPSVPDPYEANGTKKIFVETDSPFSITQDLATGAYLISIVQSPFEEVRLKAEAFFLEKLNIDKEAACKLKVNITTMRFANPNQAGQTFPLSFCTAP